ncbi:hypothetical protein PSAC2689_100177 [Paraburkholderia sacchari]
MIGPEVRSPRDVRTASIQSIGLQTENRSIKLCKISLYSSVFVGVTSGTPLVQRHRPNNESKVTSVRYITDSSSR